MKTRKQMRNIIIKKIDDILIQYYKEMDFNFGDAPEIVMFENGEERRKEAMNQIDLMWELELVNVEEYHLLKDVYREYFSLHRY